MPNREAARHTSHRPSLVFCRTAGSGTAGQTGQRSEKTHKTLKVACCRNTIKFLENRSMGYPDYENNCRNCAEPKENGDCVNENCANSEPQKPMLIASKITERRRQELTNVMTEVANERIKQDLKWGEQNHRPADWITILVEEVGEASKAALESKFLVCGKEGLTTRKALENLREELIQVAAVAVASVESLDRNELR